MIDLNFPPLKHSIAALFSRRSRSNAFTLIELLITISIIAILAVLLFPVGQKMLAAGKAAKCVSQLSQIATIFTLYQNDHSYYVPAAFGYGTVEKTGVSWYDDDSSLNAYIEGKMGRIAICPGSQTTGAGLYSPTREYKPGYPYFCNYNVMIPSRDAIGKDPPLLPLSKFGMHRPSSIVRLTCSNTKPTDWGAGDNEYNSARAGNPHNQKANVLWLDGHVTMEDTANLPARNWRFKGANYN